MRNVYVAEYEGLEKKAFSNAGKAQAWAKAYLTNVRETIVSKDDETTIIESDKGAELMIRKPDGRMVILKVTIDRLVVE